MFVEIPSFVLSLQKRQGGAALPKWLHFDEELAGRNRLGDTFTSGIKLMESYTHSPLVNVYITMENHHC